MTRIAFLFYWIFDNLAVLTKVKFFASLDLKSMARKASKCWLTGIVLGILCALLSMYKTACEEARIKSIMRKSQQDSVSLDKTQAKENYEALMKIKQQKKTNTLNIIKNLGDSITASQSLGYPSRFLGVNFSDGLVGCGGFTSAFITCYQTYPK